MPRPTDAAATEVAGPGRRRMHAAFRAPSKHELVFGKALARRAVSHRLITGAVVNAIRPDE